MDSSFVREIAKISAEVEMIEIKGRKLSSKPMHMIEPPRPRPLIVHTLTALADYMQNLANEETLSICLHIKSPKEIELISRLDDVFRGRETYVRAELNYIPFRFGEFYYIEDFIVSLQSQFENSSMVGDILKLVSNISTGKERALQDNGISQNAVVKTGIATVENVTVPNPVTLIPYRTFPEVMSPTCQFIFRLGKNPHDGEPTCTLHEADGGAWQSTAITALRNWFQHRFPDTVILA